MQPMLYRQPLTNEQLADRIREAIAGFGRQQTSIAEALDVTPQALTGWLKNGKIGRDKLAGLASLTGRPSDFFMYVDWQAGDGWDDVLGYAQAVGLGHGAEAQEYAETHKLKFRAESLSRKRLRAPALAVMYGRGDSMLPRIRPGDAILFDTSDTRPHDERLFVIMANGIAASEYSVKRCREFGDDIYFDALNPEGDHNWRKPRKMDDPKHPIQIIGRVRWIGSWED